MDDSGLDPELRGAAQRVVNLSRRVAIDPHHKARLREELLRRHQELSAGSTQRAAGTLRPRFAGLKRLTLVAPPALAAALVIGMILSALQISGHRNLQAAEAQRITNAMVRTVPTLTSWRVALHRNRTNAASSVHFLTVLTGKRLVVSRSQVYLTSGKKVFAITADEIHARRLFDWQFGFAVLPARLAQHQFRILGDRAIDGRQTEGIRYTLSQSPTQRIVATAWVDVHTGLVMRLERDVMRGSRTVERDWADYRYQGKTT